MVTNNHDAAEVKRSASGRWTDIIPALTGMDVNLLDERHHPCPKCGGTDRFRCLDADAGALYCNQCFHEKNSDGFAAVQWMTGWTFPATLKAVAEYLNLPGSWNGHATNGQTRGATVKPTAPANESVGNVPKGTAYATAGAAVVDTCQSMSKEGYELGGEWLYHGPAGEHVGTVLRFNHATKPKTFRQVSLFANGWGRCGMPEPRPLYCLPELAKADFVFVCEGEKAADAVRSIGLAATTSSQGSGSAKLTDWSPLADKLVANLPDHDGSGEKYTGEVTPIQLRLNPPPRVKVVRLPGLPEKGDFVEWLAAQPDPNDHDAVCYALLNLVEAAETVVLDVPAVAVSVVDRRSTDDESETTNIIDDPWPAPPHEDAFHGVAGDFVRLTAPHSEADSVALLVQFLVVMGNIFGRHRFFQVERTRHYPNLFTVMVGDSSRARKGTAGEHVIHLANAIDSACADECTTGGLTSGEGLAWGVRDAVEAAPGHKEDCGAKDKRLLSFESEFSTILKCKNRESNTLSEALRQAWDTGNIRNRSKGSPSRATNAHVSLIGHTTTSEFVSVATSIDATNGFFNRILWTCVRRSKLLPFGGQIQDVDFDSVKFQLREAVDFASLDGQIVRDLAATAEWSELYPHLERPRFGIHEPLCGRASAQVARLSLLHAILDRSEVIRIEHLRAANALWEYCERSVAHIFGTELPDRAANVILTALQSAGSIGLSRTRISALFGGHKSKKELDRSVQLLHSARLARRETVTTDGRPVEVWYATDSASDPAK